METQVVGQLAAQTPALVAILRRRIEGAPEEEGQIERERWLLTAAEALAHVASRPYRETADYDLEEGTAEEKSEG
jgi:hypothetical protein